MKTFYCRYPRFLRCYWSSELVRDCLNHMHINWLSIITLTFSPSTCSIYTFSNGILFRLETKRLSINLHYFIILLENTNIYLCINEIHKQVHFYTISLGLDWWLLVEQDQFSPEMRIKLSVVSFNAVLIQFKWLDFYSMSESL